MVNFVFMLNRILTKYLWCNNKMAIHQDAAELARALESVAVDLYRIFDEHGRPLVHQTRQQATMRPGLAGRSSGSPWRHSGPASGQSGRKEQPVKSLGLASQALTSVTGLNGARLGTALINSRV